MNITITGGSGFIGSNLIKALDKNLYNITVLSRSKSTTLGNIKYIQVDYHNENSLIKATEHSDVIVHLGATLFARSKSEFINENLNSTKNLVKAAEINGVKKFIYLSSLAAGGPSLDENKPRTELDPDTPLSAYGTSKLLGEKEVEKFKNDWVILRPPIVYGPKDEGFSTIAEWVRRGIMISPSSCQSRFSFIFVKDLVKCIIIAIENKQITRDKYYICEKKNYRWDEFINLMAEKMETKRPLMIKMPGILLYFIATIYEAVSFILKIRPVLNRDKVKEAIASHWIASPEKWENVSGFNNWTDIEMGLKETFSKE